jgi:hypothetical protein
VYLDHSQACGVATVKSGVLAVAWSWATAPSGVQHLQWLVMAFIEICIKIRKNCCSVAVVSPLHGSTW